MKKKLFSLLLALILALILALGCAVPAMAAEKHSEEKYLSDTLTLAGSGFDGQRSLTVSAIEAMADGELGYENVYSTMTSGSVFSKHTFTGVRLYELLVQEGLDEKLPDSTPVKFISKDGYTIALSLGELRSSQRGRYSAKGGELEEAALPILIAFASDGESLVGPTGTESVYKRFEAADGYVEGTDNIGGPLRLVMGQSSSYEFNAPMCAKWLAAVVVGDDMGYTYTRDTQPLEDGQLEPEQSGDWTHGAAQGDFRLKISGSEAEKTVYLSLSELESMKEGVVRQYFAASAGRNAYEGLPLSYIVKKYMKQGLELPTKISVKAPDGYAKTVDVRTVMEGIDSLYQPGQHRDVLIAWAVDGAPLVPGKDSEGYNGSNAYGPLRMVVENTISMWVKNVSEIVIGEECPFSDVDEGGKYYGSIMDVYEKGIMQGVGEGLFAPEGTVTRAQLVTMLWRMNAEPVVNYAMLFEDVPQEEWYGEAVRWAASEKLVTGYDEKHFGPMDPVSREQMAAIFFRYAVYKGLSAVTLEDNLSSYPDAGEISGYAVSAMNWCVGRGYIEALEDGALHPGEAAAREQAAWIISRFPERF